MRENGKKYGFQWQGRKIQFTLISITTNLMINGYNLGKNKWIPNLDDPVGDPSSGSTSKGEVEKSKILYYCIIRCCKRNVK